MSENLSTSSFKKNITFFVKILVFLLILAPVINFIGDKYAMASTENIINGFSKKRFEEFYSLEKNSLDLVFLGSSHSYCTFDPEIFDQKIGTSSYQLGMPLQHPDSTYYTLLELLNYQKPKKVVVEVYFGVMENDFELNQFKTLFQVLKNENLKQDYLKKIFPLEEQVKYKTNLFNFQSDYLAFKGNELKNKIKNKFDLKDEVAKKQEGTEEYRNKGYVFCDYKMLDAEYDLTNQFKNYDGRNWHFSPVQKEYLKKIINLCKEQGIELIFVTAPIANVSFEYIKNYDVIHEQIKNFAHKNGIEYIDYNLLNQKEKMLTNDNFRDDAHLNHSGVEIISSHFANFLADLEKS